MSNVEIRYKLGAYYKLRSLPQLRNREESAGRALASRANSMLKKNHQGFKVVSHQGARRPQGRWQVKVVAASPYARRHNAKHNTLLKALG